MHTNIRKALAFAGIATLSLSSIAQASQIGTGSVTGSPALNSAVNWNDTFPGTATGIINGIAVSARVLPTLNMVVSTGTLDLGNVTSAWYSTGTLSVELGTNAVNGASVTARSASGGLTNTTDNAVQINSLTTDGAADSYRYTSAILAATDSTVTGFTQTAALSTEVNNTSTNHTLYSSNKPQALSTGTANDDFTFSVSAQPNAQTPAGNYQDKVVLTVTGNF
jgi:hypothetical protein